MAKPSYRIDVYTGDITPRSFDAAANSVYLTLLGTKASSHELLLQRNGVDPGRNGVDTFLWRLPDLGDVRRICVRHDDNGSGLGWFLDRIEVVNEDAHLRWTFPCNRWLARHEDDGQVERVLDVA